jgi:hypothetical protein
LFATAVEMTLLTVKMDGRIGQLCVPTILFLEKDPVALLREKIQGNPDFSVIRLLPVTILTKP